MYKEKKKENDQQSRAHNFRFMTSRWWVSRTLLAVHVRPYTRTLHVQWHFTFFCYRFTNSFSLSLHSVAVCINYIWRVYSVVRTATWNTTNASRETKNVLYSDCLKGVIWGVFPLRDNAYTLARHRPAYTCIFCSTSFVRDAARNNDGGVCRLFFVCVQRY